MKAELHAELVAPKRLEVMTLLTAVSEAEFATLRDALEVSDSVLSKYLGTLEDAGFIRRRKSLTATAGPPGSRSHGAAAAR